MTSVVAALHAPRARSAPLAAGTDGPDAGFLSAGYGLRPDAWQQDVLDVFLSVRSDGRLASPRLGLAVPRQNGKNGILEMAELFKMVEQRRKILHTAHEVKTARKAFLRLASFFENPWHFPELAALVESVRKTNGQEAIQLRNGGSVEFIARSKGSGRGFTADDLVMDEAQDLTEDQLAALLPTISAAPSGDPQQVMTGTPPLPDGLAGEVFRRVRTEGVEGESLRLGWVEYGCDEDADLDDVGLWYEANPALDIRLGLDTVRDERAAMSDETFGRERLGIWGRSRRSVVIDPDLWASLADRSPVGQRPQVLRPVAFALDVTPDRAKSSVVVSAIRADGFPYVEVLANEPGTSWVVEYMAERAAKNPPCATVLDAAGPAGSLIPDFEAAGFTVVTPATWRQDGGLQLVVTSAQAMGQACGAFYDAVTSKNLRHLGDPRLTTAVDQARKRTLGDAWAWHRRDAGTDLSPLVAATLALFGFAKFGRVVPKSKAGFGF